VTTAAITLGYRTVTALSTTPCNAVAVAASTCPVGSAPNSAAAAGSVPDFGDVVTGDVT
jgi:hypothetical protein